MRDGLRKFGWFVGIWALSIAALTIVATIIRSVLIG